MTSAQPRPTIAVDLVLAHLAADEIDLHHRIASLEAETVVLREMIRILLGQQHEARLQRRRDARRPVEREA